MFYYLQSEWLVSHLDEIVEDTDDWKNDAIFFRKKWCSRQNQGPNNKFPVVSSFPVSIVEKKPGQEEDGAHDVRSSNDSGHRFAMNRMHGKQEPANPRHVDEPALFKAQRSGKADDECRGGAVERHVRQVVPESRVR